MEEVCEDRLSREKLVFPHARPCEQVESATRFRSLTVGIFFSVLVLSLLLSFCFLFRLCWFFFCCLRLYYGRFSFLFTFLRPCIRACVPFLQITSFDGVVFLFSFLSSPFFMFRFFSSDVVGF